MNIATAELMSAVGWTLVHFLWQGALIGFATALALTLLRNARPQLRYLAACAGLLACVAWPAADLCLQLGRGGAAAGTLGSSGGIVMGSAVKSAAGMLTWLQANMQWLVGAWASCALTLALRMGLGLLWLGTAGRSHTVNAEWQARVDRLARVAGVARSVRLRIVDHLASPITAGWWRPVVLVPAALVSGMPADLLEALLAHEIAHIKRHDYLVNLMQNVVEALFFYHPAVWWISGRIRAEREQIADDLAASQLGEPRRLARALSELEKLQFSSLHLAQAANGGDLFARIQRLVRPDAQALSWKAALPVLGLTLACLSACSSIQNHSAVERPAAMAPAPAASAPRQGSPRPVQDVLTAPAAPAADIAAHVAPRPIREPSDGAVAQVAAIEKVRTRAVVDFSTCGKPSYPEADLAAGHEGTVTIAFLVGADGTVVDSKITRSSGFRELDRQARDKIAECHFKPMTVDGIAVGAWVPVQYQWLLHEPAQPAAAHPGEGVR